MPRASAVCAALLERVERPATDAVRRLRIVSLPEAWRAGSAADASAFTFLAAALLGAALAPANGISSFNCATHIKKRSMHRALATIPFVYDSWRGLWLHKGHE